MLMKACRIGRVLFLPLAILFASSVPSRPAVAQSPEAKAAIQRGVSFLRKYFAEKKSQYGGQDFLAAYACIKSGVSPEDKDLARVIDDVVGRCKDGKYKPGSSSKPIYTTGCELMMLEAAEDVLNARGRYGREMEAIVEYVVKNQDETGYWNYLGGDNRGGDTSVTQYGILGLWAAARSGVDVPPQAWDRCAQWFIKTQIKRTGGFAYTPGHGGLVGGSYGMSIAGTSSLLVIRRYLYATPSSEKKSKPKPRRPGAYADLERADLDTPRAGDTPSRKQRASNYRPTVGPSAIGASIQKGMENVSSRFSVSAGRFPYYTLYTVERYAALTGSTMIGKHDWYAEGTAFLLKDQKDDGSWMRPRSVIGSVPSTSFAILFLGRATFKILGETPAMMIGEGLLRGGRGLPDDLSSIIEGKDGSIKRKKISGPIDELLSELMSPKNLEVPAVQEAIVEQIQIGDRKQWLKPERRKQLLRMANHPKAEVRRVAVWALGHTGNIDVVSVLMKALEKDPDLDVAIEARNALCFLSRKPQGFGLPAHPQERFPEGATKEQRLRIIAQWREQAVDRWKKWYFSVRPYAERDDLQETPSVN